MARKDELTGRGPLVGNNRSKALNITKRRWNLNLQNVRIKSDNNKTIQLRISTKTLRTLKKHGKLA